jgi:hypothetical protein
MLKWREDLLVLSMEYLILAEWTVPAYNHGPEITFFLLYLTLLQVVQFLFSDRHFSHISSQKNDVKLPKPH